MIVLKMFIEIIFIFYMVLFVLWGVFLECVGLFIFVRMVCIMFIIFIMYIWICYIYKILYEFGVIVKYFVICMGKRCSNNYLDGKICKKKKKYVMY